MKTPLTPESIKAICPMLVSDVTFWAGYGITTVEDLGDYLDVQAAMEVFKSENGCRISFTVEEARAYLNNHAAREAELPLPETEWPMGAEPEYSLEDR